MLLDVKYPWCGSAVPSANFARQSPSECSKKGNLLQLIVLL